jgi:hypothetical protein
VDRFPHQRELVIVQILSLLFSARSENDIIAKNPVTGEREAFGYGGRHSGFNEIVGPEDEGKLHVWTGRKSGMSFSGDTIADGQD